MYAHKRSVPSPSQRPMPGIRRGLYVILIYRCVYIGNTFGDKQRGVTVELITWAVLGNGRDHYTVC